MWKDLSEFWQCCLQQAWEGYCNGSNPVGAVVLDSDSKIISAGRNRVDDESAPPGQISSNNLAHAELNALLQIDNRVHTDVKDYTLVTTLEPCALCFGTFFLSGMRNLRYGAREPSGGSTNLYGVTEYLKSKPIHIDGPHPLVEAIHITIRTDWAFQLDIPHIIDRWQMLCPQAIQIGTSFCEQNRLQTAKKHGESISSIVSEIATKLRKLGFARF